MINGLGEEIREHRAAVEAIVAGTRTEPFQGIEVNFWTSWFKYASATRSQLETLDRPILALTGGFDRNLPVQPHLVNIRAWRGDRSTDLVAEVPRTSHALVGLEPTTFDVTAHPGALDVISGWTRATTSGEQYDLGSRLEPIDPITLARDALLCRTRDEDCDLDGIGARMSEAMSDATNPRELVDRVGERLGKNVDRMETLRIDVHGTAEETLWCQEDLASAGGVDRGILRTCWGAGPLLSGLFFK